MSIKTLLSEYGVIALLFHFTVWVISLASVYTVLSTGLDIDSLLPDWIMSDDGTAAAGVAGRAAVTVGVVEAIGPARIALTVAATPSVSKKAREFAIVRDFEALAAKAWSSSFGSSQSAE